MTIQQAVAKCTWDLLTDEEKAVVNQYRASLDDQTLKEQVGEIQARVVERRLALVG